MHKKKEEKNKKEDDEISKEDSNKKKIPEKESKKEESELEKEVEEEISQFEEPKIILKKFSPTLQKTEISSQIIPLEEQAREFILPQDKKEEKRDYTDRKISEYGEQFSENKSDYSLDPNLVKSSRFDYEILGREGELRPTLGIHKEFDSQKERDYTVRAQRFENSEPIVPFQKKKSEYRTR